jgi:hypothetical protein
VLEPSKPFAKTTDDYGIGAWVGRGSVGGFGVGSVVGSGSGSVAGFGVGSVVGFGVGSVGDVDCEGGGGVLNTGLAVPVTSPPEENIMIKATTAASSSTMPVPPKSAEGRLLDVG